MPMYYQLNWTVLKLSICFHMLLRIVCGEIRLDINWILTVMNISILCPILLSANIPGLWFRGVLN